METLSFTPIEKTVSFYTRNDFAILNDLLLGCWGSLWESARLAYRDNQGIIDEYESGVRTVGSDYDRKWLNCLKERLFDGLDDQVKHRVVDTAKSDIANILNAMAPAAKELLLFRTAWIDRDQDVIGAFAYSTQYKSLAFSAGSMIDIEIISSSSLAPYREDEDVGSDFYRYEIRVPAGNNVLPLDPYITHNEDGEVLLPPMRCRVTEIRGGTVGRCRGVIALEYLEQLRKAL